MVARLASGSAETLPGSALELAGPVLDRLRAGLPEQIGLISVGGVTTGADVAERLERGADLVQGYTAFLYEGPFWAARINRELAAASSGITRGTGRA